MHACYKYFILYHEKLNKCPKYGESRYKLKENNDDNDEDVSKKCPPAKVLWYLSIIPKFKRLFVNVNDAKNIR